MALVRLSRVPLLGVYHAVIPLPAGCYGHNKSPTSELAGQRDRNRLGTDQANKMYRIIISDQRE